MHIGGTFTIEIRRERRVVCNASKGLEAELRNHELTLGEELKGEAFEQVALDILACEAEVAQLDSSEVGRDAKHELRWESQQVRCRRHGGGCWCWYVATQWEKCVDISIGRGTFTRLREVNARLPALSPH